MRANSKETCKFHIETRLSVVVSVNTLDGNSVTLIFRVTADDEIEYDIKHVNLKAIISVGDKVIKG